MSRPHAPSRISRDADGSARIRLRFSTDEVDLIEQAAHGGEVIPWIYDAILCSAEAALDDRDKQTTELD